MNVAASIAWQDAVIGMAKEVMDPLMGSLRATLSPRGFNMSHGLRVNMGRRRGHSTLARRILMEMNAILVVPTMAPPFSDLQQHSAELKKLGREDLIKNIWPSRPLDIVGDTCKQDVIDKAFEPFTGKTVCVVDAASRLSDDELELLRATTWMLYVELG